MTDRLSPEQRHRCMSHIRSRNTQPERKVRQWLWNHGYRYRLCVKSVPGSPDIVMRKYRTAIFVNGCFWHGHGVSIPLVETHGRASLHIVNSPCCKIPNTNREFWVNKIRRNQERDQRNYQTLRDNGWQVLVVWECQLKANLLEQTMLQVEQHLLDNLIATLRPKRVLYKLPEETSLPVAAEPPAEYKASSCKSKNRN
ncbi:MAG: DNA mismatch endonuclease Vsr [Bacteroidales bacterium]|nr:DNA mismatch endonuclease Vsr [Bacteroidales bacterium]